MERGIYDHMAAHAGSHWWYVARRQVLADVIARHVALPPAPRVLEIGCGTGHNLGMLGQFGTVDAVELDDDARAGRCYRRVCPICRRCRRPAMI